MNEIKNVMRVSGVVGSRLEFSHIYSETKFYKFSIISQRLSGAVDTIPTLIPESILVSKNLVEDAFIVATGIIRTHNDIKSGKFKLMINFLAKSIQTVNEYNDVDENHVELHGFVCRRPVFRRTPLGREITDILIAVQRPAKGSDYIPVIAWGRNARFCEFLEVGSEIKVIGRMQSRLYKKLDEAGREVEHTAYEISVIRLDLVRGRISTCNDWNSSEVYGCK